MEDILIPIFICVVLPISVVFIVFFYQNKMASGKIQLLNKAIESGVELDPKGLMASLEQQSKKKPKTIKERLLNKLLWGIILLIFGAATFVSVIFIPEQVAMKSCFTIGSICCAVGIALFISYFVGRKILADEIAAETKSIVEKTDK